MQVTLLNCSGYEEALYGIGLSYGVTSPMTFTQFKSRPAVISKLHQRALELAPKGGGHNKFLEHIQLWYLVQGTRKWWSQMDTYRVGMSKQSESTMHTITKRLITLNDCSPYTTQAAVDNLNVQITNKEPIEKIKDNIPEGFLQKREMVFSLKTLINIYLQRYTHRLYEWDFFLCETFMSLPSYIQVFVLSYPELNVYFNTKLKG